MCRTTRRTACEIIMAHVILHPAVKAQMQARLAEIELLLALAERGLGHLLGQAAYRATTIANARREGVSLQEMHRRGVEGLRRNLEMEASDLRAKLAHPDN